MGFTKRNEKFIEAYLSSGNATQAAIQAGYKEKHARKHGSRLLKNVDICDRLDKRKREQREYLRMSDDDIQARLETLATTAHREADQLRALELLGKISGLMKDKQTVQQVVFNDRAAEMVTSRLRDRVKTVESVVVDKSSD